MPVFFYKSMLGSVNPLPFTEWTSFVMTKAFGSISLTISSILGSSMREITQ